MHWADVKAWLYSIIVLTLISSSYLEAKTVDEPMLLKVSFGISPPIDPLYLTSMAEYDLSLALFRTWFNYDNNRQAVPGLITNWEFNEAEGAYIFEVGDEKWSDGSELLAQHFIDNLIRIIKSNTQYGKALSSIIDIKSAKTLTNRQFTFRTRSKKSSAVLFSQLGSIFLSLVHPKDLDKKGIRLIKNSRTIGPYKIKSSNSKQTIYERNPHYYFTNSNAPTNIIVKVNDNTFSIEKFIQRKTWSNYFQTSSILPNHIATKIVASKFPIWTRGFDRVALLKPLGQGKRLNEQKKTLQFLGFHLQKINDFNHPLKVAVAKSLQPLGYPLFKEIDYENPNSTFKPSKSISILSYEMPALGFYKEWIEMLGKKFGIKIEWKLVDSKKFLNMDWSKSSADFALFSFGVADPEPTTWLSLIFQSKFIHFGSKERASFQKLMRVNNTQDQVNGYRDLLCKIGKDGGYLPLLYGATLSIGVPGMDFSLVGDLDETVSYSKIQFIK